MPEEEAEETSPFEELGQDEHAGAELTDAEAEELLAEGELAVIGQLMSSNETFLVQASDGGSRGSGDGRSVWGIYKPVLGERPLSDFAPGLHRRECAAHMLSRHLGWDLVPLTVLRDDAPFGEGSIQRFVVSDVREHYFTLVGESEAVDAQLRRLALFDVLVANADRKSGHVLMGADGRIRGIDHGLCFHEEFKLRTVIWDFAGQAIDQADIDAVAELIDEVPADVAELLSEDEARALSRRARFVLASGVLPHDRTGMRFPWPLV